MVATLLACGVEKGGREGRTIWRLKQEMERVGSRELGRSRRLMDMQQKGDGQIDRFFREKESCNKQSTTGGFPSVERRLRVKCPVVDRKDYACEVNWKAMRRSPGGYSLDLHVILKA
jgi:hypothetical protein